MTVGIKSICQLVIAYLGVLAVAYAEPTSTRVQLAVENSWPPYSDVNGQGLSTDLVSAAYRAVGARVTVKVLPYARVEESIQAGLVDGGYNVTRQSSTEDVFLFGSEVLLTAAASIYVNVGGGANYKSYDDIPSGARIGLIIGYEYGDIYQQNSHRFNEVRVSTQSQLIKMIKAGRIDMAIMFDEVAAYTLRELGLPMDAIDKSFLNHISDIYVGFSLKRASSSHYAELLDKGLRLLRETGEYQTLVELTLRDASTKKTCCVDQ